MKNNRKRNKKPSSGGKSAVKKEKKPASAAGGRAIVLALLKSVIAATVVFAAVILLLGYICYQKEISSQLLWLVYLAAAVLSTGTGVTVLASRLPMRGILTGLAGALFFVILHSAVITSLNPGETGNHSMIILCAVIAAALTAGIVGANIGHRRGSRQK